MNKPCINKGRNHIKNIELEICGSLHQINISFYRKLIVDIFHREIAYQFFRRIIRNLSGLFICLCSLKCLIQFFYFFLIKGNRIINALSLKFVNVSQCFIRTMCPSFSFRIIKTLINLKISPLFVIGFKKK